MIGCGRACGSGNRWDGVKRHERKPFTPRWLLSGAVLSPVCAVSPAVCFIQWHLSTTSWGQSTFVHVRAGACIYLPCQGFARLRNLKAGSWHYAAALCWPPRGHSFVLWALLWMLQCHIKTCYQRVHRSLLRNCHRGPKPAEKKTNKWTFFFFFFSNKET